MMNTKKMNLPHHVITCYRGGLCSLPECWGTPVLPHTRKICPSLSNNRMELIQFKFRILLANPSLEDLVLKGLTLYSILA
jgi:hypothetical protein